MRQVSCELSDASGLLVNFSQVFSVSESLLPTAQNPTFFFEVPP